MLVPDDARGTVADVLDDEGVDFVRQRAWIDDDEGWLFTFPVPTDAVGYFLGRLEDAGVDVDRYTVITGLESAMTTRAEPLMQRFGRDFDPISSPEVRSKARDLSYDPRSFAAMISLSTVIATAGLLVDSFAIVVGSMVIAPLVGPVLTAAVGGATGDREMLVESVWLQVGGLGLAVVAAAAFGLGLRASGFVPGGLAVTALDSIAVRIAPGLLSVAVATAAGAASAFGLATKGPTSLIGVMIAAALIPAAAAAGVAAAWVEPRVAIGALLLLVVSTVLINASAYAVLRWLGYGPEDRWWRRPSVPTRRRIAVVVTALGVLLLVGATLAGSYQQLDYERTVNREVEAVLSAPEYGAVSPVAVRIEYAGTGPFATPETVTVVASLTGTDPPQVADDIAARIRAATGEDVSVRVRFLEYQDSTASGSDGRALIRPTERRPARARQPPRPSRVRGVAAGDWRPGPPTA